MKVNYIRFCDSEHAPWTFEIGEIFSNLENAWDTYIDYNEYTPDEENYYLPNNKQIFRDDLCNIVSEEDRFKSRYDERKGWYYFHYVDNFQDIEIWVDEAYCVKEITCLLDDEFQGQQCCEEIEMEPCDYLGQYWDGNDYFNYEK